MNLIINILHLEVIVKIQGSLNTKANSKEHISKNKQTKTRFPTGYSRLHVEKEPVNMSVCVS